MGVAGSTSASADGEKAAEERGLEKSGTILIHHPACELHDVPGEEGGGEQHVGELLAGIVLLFTCTVVDRETLTSAIAISLQV